MKLTNLPIMTILNYQQEGEGENIVLIHGLLGSLENLGMVAKALIPYFKVTRLDVRNHGHSFHQAGMNYQTLAQDVLTTLEHLNINQTHLLGHSMGGKIAMQLAVTCPHLVNSLIVADIAPVQYPAHHQAILQGLKSIDLTQCQSRNDADKQLAQYVDNTGIRQFLLRNLAKDAQNQWGFKCHLAHIESGYPDIMKGMENTRQYQGNTLFVKGGNSDYITADHQEKIRAIFPNARAKIIQGAGHWLHAEKSLAFNKIILDFLTSTLR